MKDLKEFIDTLVKIEFLDHCNTYGFYPFQMVVEDKEGKLNMVSLDLGGDIRAVYTAFNDYFKENPKRIYLAVDYPAGMDIINDFVCVIGYENSEFTLYAIPYDLETGETLSDIRDAEILDRIHDDLGKFIY